MLISSFSDLFFPLFSIQNVFGLVILFIVTSTVIYGGGLSILNGFVRIVSTELRYKRKDIRLLFKTLSIIQYLIILILTGIVIQIILQHQYSSSLIILVTIVSYVPATLILGILSYRLIAWFKISKDAITFLFFLGPGCNTDSNLPSNQNKSYCIILRVQRLVPFRCKKSYLVSILGV